MATSTKTFRQEDIASIKTKLHEAIPITGTIVSGTYSDNNVKNYSHGMWQSVYDYPYLSSSANHIFDITCGYSADSSYSGSSNVQNSKKIQIYNSLAQQLVGFDSTGSVMRFDADGDLSGGTKIKEAVFLNFARLLTKDGIKRGSFSLEMYTSGSWGTLEEDSTITDAHATSTYFTNSPAGEYATLKVDSTNVGLLYYQAGVAVLTASLFADASEFYSSSADEAKTVDKAFTESSISGTCDAIRHRMIDLDFVNTVELNSRVYHCRANHNEFNYSSNPTYLSDSKIRVKSNSTDLPVSYITTVGLYSADNVLMAVAKVSEPLRKDPNGGEITIRVRLDY